MTNTRLVLAAVLIGVETTLSAVFPKPQGPVSDFAGILDSAARTQLATLLRETRQETSAEIAVVTVLSLDGMPIDEYANRLYQEWGIGRKGRDNGVLVLVAPVERKVRIEVGYGLEPILPDGLAGEIIRTDILPRFRAGDYPGGVLRGAQHVAVIVRRNERLSPDERRRLSETTQNRPPTLLVTPFFGIFIALGAFAVGYGLRSRLWFAVLWGGIFGGIPSVMAASPFFNASVWVLGALAAGMFVWGYRKGRSPGWLHGLSGGFTTPGAQRRWASDGDRSDASGSPSSSGSSDSGSDSFGGGSSGGGGASGSW